MPFFRRHSDRSEMSARLVAAGIVAAPERPADPAIRVIVIDDDRDVRDGLRLTLERDGFDVVGTAADGASAQALVATAGVRADIIVIDLHLPDVGGIELMPILHALAPRSKFVVLSAIHGTHIVEAAMDAGAVAFIEKGLSSTSISLHLERVAVSGSVKVVRPFPLNREYPSAS